MPDTVPIKTAADSSSVKITHLIKKGVRIPAPESIYVADTVDIERISGENTTIYPGCKLFGASTLMCAGSELGYEAPATVENCFVGPHVKLKGGFFKEAAFLYGASVGSGAHIRQGTILEENASAAHTVGLKQTILFPYVTLGSLINFCDCLMAGGTGPRDHSEVGSSFIHFNFTPNQDKATPSLVGDVPNGVMLNQAPVFLGGQGGVVGPCRLAFGTVTAAGSITRKDELRPGRLLFEGGKRGGSVPYTGGAYSTIKRLLENNLVYIANLIALSRWYQNVRYQFISAEFPALLWEGLKTTLELGVDERIKQLDRFAENLASFHRSKADGSRQEDAALLPSVARQKLFLDKWPEIKMLISDHRSATGESRQMHAFLDGVRGKLKAGSGTYVETILALSDNEILSGSAWLQSLVDGVVDGVRDVAPGVIDPAA
jgi:hypothetical protein